MCINTKTYIVNLNRLLIFILITLGVVFNSDVLALFAAGYWLWLPNIERIECLILHIDKSEINYPSITQTNEVEHDSFSYKKFK